MNYGKPTLLRVFLTTAVLTSLAALLFPVAALAYQGAPISQTTPATHITEKSATLHGVVSVNEMPDTYQWYEWGVSGHTDVTYQTQPVHVNGQGVNISLNVVGLAPNTQYFYRQISESSRGKSVGSTVYFTTKPLAPDTKPIIVVQTNAPLAITEKSATLKGYVSPHGNNSARWWFEWGVTNTLEHQTPGQSIGTDSRIVEAQLTGLVSGTVYFYRIVGDNGEGRVYGATRVFVTLGTPPPVEAPHAQSVAMPQEGTDGVVRTVTNTGSAASGVQQNVFSQGLPGDFLGNFLRSRKNTEAPSGETNNTQTSGTVVAPEVAGATAPGPLARLLGVFSSEKGVVVTVEKIGPSRVPAHTPVEYKIMYAYRQNDVAVDARLKITLPGEIVYIGDNTTNELLLEEGDGPQRTYVLPIGRLEKGSTRTISILGMTTGDAKGFPDAYARMEFLGSNGQLQIIAAGTGAIDENTKAESAGQPKKSGNTAGVALAGGILPSSLLGWLLYIAFVAGAIFTVRKAKAYYEQRKEELAGQAEESPKSKPMQDTTQWLDELRAHKNSLPT